MKGRPKLCKNSIYSLISVECRFLARKKKPPKMIKFVISQFAIFPEGICAKLMSCRRITQNPAYKLYHAKCTLTSILRIA